MLSIITLSAVLLCVIRLGWVLVSLDKVSFNSVLWPPTKAHFLTKKRLKRQLEKRCCLLTHEIRKNSLRSFEKLELFISV
jgi:hypothetical protein